MIPDEVLAEAWPAGDLRSWADDDERVVWDFTVEPPWAPSRPYTAEENADADERAAAVEAAARPVSLRSQIAAALEEEPSLERTFLLVELLARLALEVP